MDIFSTWLFLFILGLSLALPLGPVNVEIIKQALFEKKHLLGFFLALSTGLGAMCGDFTISFSVLTLGSKLLTSIINDYAIRTILFTFNVLLLGYLGISTLRKKFSDTEIHVDQELALMPNNTLMYRIGKRLITGFAIVVSSPWSYLWWASFGTYIIFGDFNSFDLYSRLVVIFFFLSGIFFWVISFSSLLTLSKKFAKSSFLNIITKASAIILLIYATDFAINAVTYLQLWLFPTL